MCAARLLCVCSAPAIGDIFQQDPALLAEQEGLSYQVHIAYSPVDSGISQLALLKHTLRDFTP